jgi:hypothetical protein
MNHLARYRMMAQSLAPLRARTAEGAQATELWQDKRDGLRPCLAVGLSLLVNNFAQAAFSSCSLSYYASACSTTRIFTSSVCAYGQ